MNKEIEFIESTLNEARQYIKQHNPVQASEKIYKVVEECIKLLAEKNKLTECEKAKKKVDGGLIYLEVQHTIYMFGDSMNINMV